MGRIRGDLGERSFAFALDVLSLIDDLPAGTVGWVLGKQLTRSGTAVGANLREADQAITDADFAHKCSIARKEAAESQYWLEPCTAAGLLSGDAVDDAIHEADELTRILASLVKKTQAHIAKSKRE